MGNKRNSAQRMSTVHVAKPISTLFHSLIPDDIPGYPELHARHSPSLVVRGESPTKTSGKRGCEGKQTPQNYPVKDMLFVTPEQNMQFALMVTEYLQGNPPALTAAVARMLLAYSITYP